MSLYKFDRNDLFYNRIKNYPSLDFYIYSGTIIYNKDTQYTGDLSNTNITHVPPGNISLYELNIDRPTNQLIFPFITKQGSLTSFKTVTTSQFNNDFAYGDRIDGTYPLSASISSDRFATDVTGSACGYYRDALENTLNKYACLSPHYLFSSSLGDKGTQEMRIISIPSIFYGSSIKKGSCSLKFFISGTQLCELRDDKYNGELRQVRNTLGTVASSSLVGMWNFDQTLGDNEWNFGDVLDDYSGNGYDMTPRPAACDIPQVPGKCEQAAFFNGPGVVGGDDEHFRVDIPLVDGGITGSVEPAGGFSVCTWVSRSVGFLSPLANDLVPVISAGRPFIGWELQYNDWDAANATVTWRVQDTNAMAWMIWTTSSAPVGVDGWTHLVGTYQAGGTPHLYVNGELQADEGIQLTIGVPTGEINGTRIEIAAGGEPDRTPSGSIDDCGLYSKVLSTSEIKTLYEGGACHNNELLGTTTSVGGVVLYDQGFVVLTGSWDLKDVGSDIYYGGTPTNPRWIDFGFTGSTAPSSSFQMSFSGTNYVPTMTMLTHMPKGQLNFSNNPTFLEFGQTATGSSTGSYLYSENSNIAIKNIIKTNFPDPTGSYRPVTYINKVGIYDKDKNLIAVAKLANPVRKRETDEFTLKLKLDF